LASNRGWFWQLWIRREPGAHVSGRAAFAPVMQPADVGDGNDAARFRWLHDAVADQLYSSDN
jgi:hypothetical protein